ncbi:MAG: phosphoribosylanthranilate isomerase [Pseudomonadota bacterium]
MGLIKICGVRTTEAGLAAAEAGVDLIGFVFVPKSPRQIQAEVAADVVTDIKQGCYDGGLEPPRFVGLFVDPGETLLAETAPFLNFFQLHGHEDEARVEEIGTMFGLDVIKAIPVGEAGDFDGLSGFAEAADMLLFDARPPKGADLTGGNGVAFDWSLLSHYQEETPFLLAGGLTADNVSEAVTLSKVNKAFAGVDVSSGVESKPGHKDAALIKAFAKTARAAVGPPVPDRPIQDGPVEDNL